MSVNAAIVGVGSDEAAPKVVVAARSGSVTVMRNLSVMLCSSPRPAPASTAANGKSSAFAQASGPC